MNTLKHREGGRAGMRAGWEVKTLGEVCEFQRGLTYAKSDEVDLSNNVVLRATNINLQSNLLIFEELKYISEQVVVPKSKKVKKDSLMICMASGSKTHLGKVAYIDEEYDYAFGGFMGMITPMTGLSPKYLFHLLTSENYKDFISALSDGANINNLTFDKLRAFPIPLPPLAEQQRIVAILDEAFEGIATARKHAEQNLQNAKALFESHLEAVFSNRGEGWVEKSLETVGSILIGYSFNSSDFSCNEGTRCIKITNVGVREFVSTSDGFLPNSFSDDFAKVSVKEGSIVIALTRTIIADGLKVAVVPKEYDGALLNQRVASITVNENEMSTAFLFAYLTSQRVVDYVKAHVNTLMQPNLSIADLRSLPTPTPPRQYQDKTTVMLDALRDETNRLCDIYTQKIAALDALKKSLLHQAFSGEL